MPSAWSSCLLKPHQIVEIYLPNLVRDPRYRHEEPGAAVASTRFYWRLVHSEVAKMVAMTPNSVNRVSTSLS